MNQNFNSEPISIATRQHGGARPQAVAQPRLRITQRGQIVLVALTALILALVVGMFTFGVSGANASSAETKSDFSYVSIHAGETLWDLATRLDPHADPRDVIAEIMQLNALTSSEVEVGQRIALPERFA